jgi:hypothetical protein
VGLPEEERYDEAYDEMVCPKLVLKRKWAYQRKKDMTRHMMIMIVHTLQNPNFPMV